MNNTLITEISSVLTKFAPLIILFFVGVIVLYNLRDMIVQWFIGISLKFNRQINEFDLFEIDGERCLLVRINSFRLYFLVMDKDNNLLKKSISIGNKQFIMKKITKLGRFI